MAAAWPWVQYTASTRDSRHTGLPDTRQTAESYSLLYTCLSDTRFGAVEWRGDGGR